MNAVNVLMTTTILWWASRSQSKNGKKMYGVRRLDISDQEVPARCFEGSPELSVNLNCRRRQVGTKMWYQRYNYIVNTEEDSEKEHNGTISWATHIEVPSNATLNWWVKCAIAWSNDSSNCCDEGQECVLPNCTNKIQVKITATLFCMISMYDTRIAWPCTWLGFEFNRAEQLHSVNLWLKTWTLYYYARILNSSKYFFHNQESRKDRIPTGSNQILTDGQALVVNWDWLLMFTKTKNERKATQLNAAIIWADHYCRW